MYEPDFRGRKVEEAVVIAEKRASSEVPGSSIQAAKQGSANKWSL
jgi:hypothetical protein